MPPIGLPPPTLTIEHVDPDGRRVGVGRHAGVVARVGQLGPRDEQLGRGALLGALRLQRDAAARRVEVHDGGAMVPQHGAGRRRVHIDRARQADGRPLLHEHLLGARYVGLGRCEDRELRSALALCTTFQSLSYHIIGNLE